MGLKISSELRAKLLSEATAAYPNECCGLLLGQRNVVTRTQFAMNVSSEPQSHFEIDPAVLIAAEKSARAGAQDGEGRDTAILGYYHSHPSGPAVPSATDAEMAAADGRYWVIISDTELGVFRAVKDGALWGRFEQDVLLT